ncbi:pyocin activator PrtN family protein [Beijerinckia sp. L45]|uniref:pyocin activator PrtN family protein n=1 Tax=Beijerinckia sp. L45 TaxID=1641855 RepID=UPI00131DA8D2|nr:pyocin activator PrtN family protein [Beijerinckia sp. L45]
MKQTLNTIFLLAAVYDGRPIIPLEEIRKDYFHHLTMDGFLRKLGSGDIQLPVIRMEGSKKAPKGVHLTDLANYIDERRKEALREFEQLSRDNRTIASII